MPEAIIGNGLRSLGGGDRPEFLIDLIEPVQRAGQRRHQGKDGRAGNPRRDEFQQTQEAIDRRVERDRIDQMREAAGEDEGGEEEEDAVNGT